MKHKIVEDVKEVEIQPEVKVKVIRFIAIKSNNSGEHNFLEWIFEKEKFGAGGGG